MLKSLETAGLFIKIVSKTVKNEVKEQKGGSPGMLKAALAESLLGSAVAGKGVIISVRETNRAGPNF